MRFLIGLTFVFALCLAPLAGCSETPGTGGNGGSAGGGGTGGIGGSGGTGGNGGMGGDGGTGGTAGSGGAGGMTGQEFPCTEAGIRDAIAKGGGPHYFDCDGTKPVVTQQTIVIDKSVVLDGEGKLTVDGNDTHRVFRVTPITGNAGVKLRGITVTRGRGQACSSCQAAGAILNQGGRLTLVDCTVTENQNLGFNPFGVGLPGNILNAWGAMTIINSTVSNNIGGGIGSREGWLTITNSTVSNNIGLGPSEEVWPYGVFNLGQAFLTNSTISGSVAIYMRGSGQIQITATLIDGACTQRENADVTRTSNGYNIESPGNTCGFDQETDKTGVTPEELNLGPLENNGGLTETHEPGGGEFGTDSVAIDQIPAADCVDPDGAPLTTDQRGEPRPAGAESKCDIGSFEVQEGDR